MAKRKGNELAVYNSAGITLSDGDEAGLFLDSQGRLSTTSAPLSSTTDEVSTVSKPVSTSTGSNVNSSATSVTILASNTSRRAASIFNHSTQDLYIKEGTTASATDFLTIIPPNSLYELPSPMYTGKIDGIWTAANGAARVVEKV